MKYICYSAVHPTLGGAKVKPPETEIEKVESLIYLYQQYIA